MGQMQCKRKSVVYLQLFICVKIKCLVDLGMAIVSGKKKQNEEATDWPRKNREKSEQQRVCVESTVLTVAEYFDQMDRETHLKI